MPDENVEILLRGIRLTGQGATDELADVLHPEIVAEGPEGWPEAGVEFVGREAVIGQTGRLIEDWGRQKLTVHESTADGQWVAARLQWDVRGAASGLEFEVHFAVAARVRDAMLAEVRIYWDYGEALAAAGLAAG